MRSAIRVRASSSRSLRGSEPLLCGLSGDPEWPRDVRPAPATAAGVQDANQEERVLRAGTVTALQNSITKDANGRVTSGTLNGPAITSTSCTPLGGGSTDDLTAHTGTFTCIAIDQTNSDGTQQGYSFSATVNYDTGSYTWQLAS
jgi:hypothetical protein